MLYDTNIADSAALNSPPTRAIIPLVCDCANCRLPFATLEAGALWIQSTHNGEKHRNRVQDEIILQLASAILLKQLVST